LQEIAQSIISGKAETDAEGNALNPLDSQFLSLGLTAMDPVSQGTVEWNGLQQYVTNTHGKTHHIKVDLLNAYRIDR